MKQVMKWETAKGEFYDTREAAEKAEERDSLCDHLESDSTIDWREPDINQVVLSVLAWLDLRNSPRSA